MVMMNANRLSELFNDVDLATESDVQELKSLTELHPYFFKPFAVLTKIYLKKHHYRFEEYLFKTSLRCNDRAWLHDYLYDFSKHNIIDVVTPAEVEKIEINSAEPEVKNSINDFLVDENSQTIKEELIDNNEEQPLETSNKLDLEQQSTDPDLETIEEATNEVEIIESSTENQHEEISFEELQNQTQVSENEIHPLKDVNAFLEENTEQRDNQNELPIEFELGISNDSETIENEENKDLEELETEFILGTLPNDENEVQAEHIQLADIQTLRKNPVYNVESFLNEDKEQVNRSIKTSTGEKDFFSWLYQPNLPATEQQTEENSIDSLSIIDKFIELIPQISRPKKEFYNPENMAKKSEQFESLFMTETLANLYYEQGNFSLAIKAYEKLSLQNPEKQTYFASLIEKIKKNK